MVYIIVGAIIVVAIFAVIAAVKSLLVICPPNRVAIISGRSREMPDGRKIGYRLLQGGRTMRIPMLEKVDWVELNTMPIEVSVTNAFCKGAIPLNVQGIANVKVSSSEGLLLNSVERFLHTDQSAIARIAQETLEANLRGVLATLTPEEVNEDRLKFSETLIDEADDDIKTLGLELDTLKIQNVTDEVGYLESVGRRQTAEVLKSARVAEALRSAESEEAEAEGRQRAEIAGFAADLKIVDERNALRVRTAELEAIAAAKEAEAMVAGEKARVVAQQALEQERIGLEQRRLEADVVAPARANLEAKRLDAEAAAATIVEDGKAQVEVFQRLVAQYQAAGSDAQQIFVLNMLPDIIDRLVSTVNGVAIDKISIIDGGGQGTGIPGMLGQLPAAVISLAEQIETATGVDILGTLRNDGDRSGGGASGVPAVAAAPAPETATSSPEPAPEPVSKPEPSPKPEATWEPEPEPEPEPAPEPQRWRTTSSPTPPARPGPLPPPPASRPYPGSPPPPSPPGPRG